MVALARTAKARPSSIVEAPSSRPTSLHCTRPTGWVEDLHVWVLTPIKAVVTNIEIRNVEVALVGLEHLAEKTK